MMLQLGAIKKIRKNFFSRVLVLSGIERGKNYGKRFILDLKARNQISQRGFLKNQFTKSIFTILENCLHRGPNLIENPCVDDSFPICKRGFIFPIRGS